jgi:putative effector of murein hydrolase LrgA (UPF0299 family)
MSRFEQEWAVVPTAARWIAALVTLLYLSLMAAIFVPAVRSPQFLLAGSLILFGSLAGAVAIAIYTLVVGYVYGDSRRRGMSPLLWTLLAVFIPSGVGIILYFILREPIAVPCPACGTPARKGHAFCARCGGAVRKACAQCRQPVEPAWRNCPGCGASLTAGGAAQHSPQ